MVAYTDEIVKYNLISAISDEEIKKDVLRYYDLDNKSHNETISKIKNKEMTARVMSSYSSSTTKNAAIHQDSIKLKSNDNITAKLNIKTSCQSCEKPVSKFKLRREKINEFTHCIQRSNLLQA